MCFVCNILRDFIDIHMFCALGRTIAIVLMFEIQFIDVSHLSPKSLNLLRCMSVREIVKLYEFSARYCCYHYYFSLLFLFYFYYQSNNPFFSGNHAQNNAIHFNNVSFIYFFFNFAGRECFRFDRKHVRHHDRALLLPSEFLREPDVHYAREHHLGCQPKNTAETQQ